MLETGSKEWSVGLDEVMRQINESPYEGLPIGVTPNMVMFGRKRKMKTRDLPSMRGVIMTVNEEAIDRICNDDISPDPDEDVHNMSAVELALGCNILEDNDGEDEGGQAESEPEPERSADPHHPSHSSSILSSASLSSSPHSPLSPKGKSMAVDMTLSDQEAEDDPEATAEEEDDEDDEDDEEVVRDTEQSEDESREGSDDGDNQEDEEDEEDIHPNAREAANDAVRALDAQVQQHQARQREKMQKKYNASCKIHIFNEDDFATLAIPKEDRAATDNTRLEVKILEIPRKNRHRVQSKYGVIKGLIPTTSLNAVPKQHIADLVQQFQNAPTREIPLSRAAAENSNTTYVALACNCKKRCTKSCRCVKNSKPCTQYCHKSEIECGNLPDTILELTEAHMIPRVEYNGNLKAPKRKRAATTASTKKPAAKRAISSRNQPSSAEPATTRARAKGREPPIDPTLNSGQTTMSQFESFAPLAHRHTQKQVKKAGRAQKK